MADNTFLPAYLTVGDDALKRQAVEARLVKRISALGDLSFNSDTFDGEKASGSAIVDACNTMPFASEVRLVTVRNADKLKSMISSDPDTVVSFFSGLFKNLYAKMSDLSKSVDGYRTFGNFYDDKKMKSDYDDYKTKISDLEEKLNDYEDKWYSKFSKMETALAKLQSNSSAVTSLLGGS